MSLGHVPVACIINIFWQSQVTIINDTSTINVIDNASLALASIVNYDRKWRYNLEHNFDDTRSVNYDRNTFIIQATDAPLR